MDAKPENHWLYNKRLRNYARKNRGEMTKAEACLWKYALRAKTMGVTFNRQRPVLNYIADFLCKELKLIIEVDGLSHHFQEVIEKDIVRQRHLENAGFRVLRFKDEEVLEGMQEVRMIIYGVIEELKKKEIADNGLPQPPRRGGQ